MAVMAGKEGPMKFDYQGPAELIDHEGNVVDVVTASLNMNDESWEGHSDLHPGGPPVRAHC